MATVEQAIDCVQELPPVMLKLERWEPVSRALWNAMDFPDDAVRLDAKFLVNRAELRSHLAGVAGFVEFRDRETNRKGPHRLPNQFCHQPDDDRRIDAAGEKRPERHVALQPLLHGGRQGLSKLSPIIGRRTGD